jgi:hypothetical protein
MIVEFHVSSDTLHYEKADEAIEVSRSLHWYYGVGALAICAHVRGGENPEWFVAINEIGRVGSLLTQSTLDRRRSEGPVADPLFRGS